MSDTNDTYTDHESAIFDRLVNLYLNGVTDVRALGALDEQAYDDAYNEIVKAYAAPILLRGQVDGVVPAELVAAIDVRFRMLADQALTAAKREDEREDP
jgi:hypothetical protein